MPPTAPAKRLAASPDVARRVLDDIEDQFHLDQDDLIAITTRFLEEIHSGLLEYNHPMAMMCVCFSPPTSVANDCNSPTFVTGVPDGTETG